MIQRLTSATGDIITLPLSFCKPFLEKSEKSFWEKIFTLSVLTLSVSLSLASSPKGGASGETGNFAWNAKASPFGRGGIAEQ